MQLPPVFVPHTGPPSALDLNRVSQEPGRVSPDDLGMHDYSLGGSDDEMDRLDDGSDGTESLDGEFSAMCVGISNSSESYVFTDIDAVDSEEDETGPDEPTDITDADDFEILMQRNTQSRMTIPNQHAIDVTGEVPNIPIEQAIPFNLPNAERSPTAVISHFPSDQAGAPIPSAPQGSLACQLNEDTVELPVWAPFVSQCDWEVAHWAKTHGPTSSAVMDLLAIEQVCILFSPI